jgi:hypothetical protein
VSGEEPWKKFSKGGPVDYCFIEWRVVHGMEKIYFKIKMEVVLFVLE